MYRVILEQLGGGIVTRAELEAELREQFGRLPPIVDRHGPLQIRAYVDDGRYVFDGEPAFDVERWGENPFWVTVAEPYYGAAVGRVFLCPWCGYHLGGEDALTQAEWHDLIRRGVSCDMCDMPAEEWS